MIGKILATILCLLVVHNVQCQKPPTISESFIAWGEIVQPFPNTSDLITMQTSFEESYDSGTGDAAFFLYMLGKKLTFVKHHSTNQTFLYTKIDDKNLQCTETSEIEYMESDFAPGLLAFEDDDGSVRFSVFQLLNIPEKFMMTEVMAVPTTYRGIAAKSWTYTIDMDDKETGDRNTLTIESFWSDGTWNTSAGPKTTPLGFNISKIMWDKKSQVAAEENFVINIFGFINNAYDYKFFKPVEGVICASRKQTLKFPSVRNIRAMSLRFEMALPQNQELRYTDTWFDPVNQLFRVDVERMKDDDPMRRKEKAVQMEIAVGKMAVVFRWSAYKGESKCEVIPIDRYENDFQNVFNVKQILDKWQVGKIFGLNDTSYTYTGRTIKNDVPCHLFQGIRKDWPDVKANLVTLWEWCFNVNMTNEKDVVLFQNNEFGLISANVKVISDPLKVFNGYPLKFHFYGVQPEDPDAMFQNFDIGRCFSDQEKRLLQFSLDLPIGKDNFEMYENATADIRFLKLWRSALYTATGLRQYTLRISNIRATIEENKMFIKFSILNRHPGLPPSQPNTTATEAETKLRDNMRDGKVSVSYAWKKDYRTTVKPEPESLTFQIDSSFKPQTVSPPPIRTTATTGPHTFPFSLRTESPDDKTTSGRTVSGSSPATAVKSTVPGEKTTNPSTHDKTASGQTIPGSSPEPGKETTTNPTTDDKIVKYTGHQPGAVAAVAISMLLIGVSIGAGGTFYKFNGLPPCMKR